MHQQQRAAETAQEREQRLALAAGVNQQQRDEDRQLRAASVLSIEQMRDASQRVPIPLSDAQLSAMSSMLSDSLRTKRRASELQK